MIATLDDVVEAIADQAGVYGTHGDLCDGQKRACRCCWTAHLRASIVEAVRVEVKLGTIDLNAEPL